jgi:hypothetical protein
MTVRDFRNEAPGAFGVKPASVRCVKIVGMPWRMPATTESATIAS